MTANKSYGSCPPGWVYSHHEGVPQYGDGGRVDACPLVPVYVPTLADRSPVPPEYVPPEFMKARAAFPQEDAE